MLEFCFLILTITEICLTIFIVAKIIDFEKKVNEVHRIFLVKATEFLILNDKILETVKKLNKVLKFISNKKFYQTISIIKTVFNTVQIILLIRSFDFSKGRKLLNYKNFKRLLFSEVARRFARKMILSSGNLV